MPIHKPKQEELFQFIAQTHIVEKLPCDQNDVQATIQKRKVNWYADGHLRAFSWAINNLLDSSDYPSRKEDIQHIYQAEEAIFWVKNIYSTALTPVANNPTDFQFNENRLQEDIQLQGLMGWRHRPADNLYTPAPDPALIPPIMTLWLKKLLSIHLPIRNNLDNPYGIDKAQFRQMKEFYEEIPLFFSSVQPFQYANNRMGRLIEQVVRLGWRQPMNYQVISSYEDFKANLEPYQRNVLPTLLKDARALLLKS